MPKKDLRQMKKEKQNKKANLSKENIEETAKKAKLNVNPEAFDQTNIQNVEETIKEYENKSEGELMSDLESMISEGKNDGTFSNEMMEAFINNVSPMMNNEQQQKLKSIAKMIKRD